MNKINFQITGKCNMDCKFCCDTFKYQKGKSLEEVKTMIDRLPDYIDEINITGGEPLVYPEIEEVLKHIHDKGIKTYLTTNGVLLPEKESVLKYVDRIYLPLDSVYEKTLKNLGREDNQIINTIQNVGLVHSKYPEIEVVINTVLTGQNYQEVGELFGLVRLLDCQEWHIRQFLPHGNGKDNIRKFILDDRDFEKSIEMLRYSELEDKIVAIPVSKMVNNEWTITPNFQLTRLKDSKASIHGNILEMNDDILRLVLNPITNKVKRQTLSQH